jgi:polar amino acid transport system permease protein
MIGLIVHQSGFIADVTAAGLRSVPREQLEGAYASGLSMPQVFVHVLLPQALSFVIPPLTSQFIELAKNTALVMLIGLQDLTFVAQNINVETYRYLESFITVTVLYVVIVLFIVAAMAALGRTFGRRRAR